MNAKDTTATPYTGNVYTLAASLPKAATSPAMALYRATHLRPTHNLHNASVRLVASYMQSVSGADPVTAVAQGDAAMRLYVEGLKWVAAFSLAARLDEDTATEVATHNGGLQGHALARYAREAAEWLEAEAAEAAAEALADEADEAAWLAAGCPMDWAGV